MILKNHPHEASMGRHYLADPETDGRVEFDLGGVALPEPCSCPSDGHGENVRCDSNNTVIVTQWYYDNQSEGQHVSCRWQ